MSDDKTEDTESPAGLGGQVEQMVMPLQPIQQGRFVCNRIVCKLLELALIDMNEIAVMDFTDQERIQFAQLIGYSLSGFAELSYVDDESYESAARMSEEGSELEARNAALRKQLDDVRRYLRQLVPIVFRIHPDDLEV